MIASAGTVIVGLGMLYFSSFAKIKYTGPTIALSLAVALAASLTLAPALLACLRGAMFWPFRAPHHTPGRDRESESLEALPMTGFWVRVADLVVQYPLAILSVCLVVLAHPRRGRGSHQVELQPARRPRPGPAERDRGRASSGAISRSGN